MPLNESDIKTLKSWTKKEASSYAWPNNANVEKLIDITKMANQSNDLLSAQMSVEIELKKLSADLLVEELKLSTTLEMATKNLNYKPQWDMQLAEEKQLVPWRNAMI